MAKMCLQRRLGTAFSLSFPKALNVTRECVPNENARPVKSHLRRFFGNAQDLRHFPGIELFHIAKD